MEAYANDACRTVAAQVSEAVGFQAMTQSTADTLADVLARYIEEVGYQAHSLTEASNRTHDNALDVRQSLMQCGTSLNELYRFMGRNELRYAKAEVAFPVQRPPAKSSLASRFGAEQGEKRLAHMPDFLPALPPQHSYMSSVKQSGPRGDAKWIKKQKHKERQQIEQSLHNMAASSSGKSAKKRPPAEAFGAPQAEEVAGGEASSTDAAAHVNPIQLEQAAQLNDVLADAAETLKSAAVAPPVVEEEEAAAAKAREYSLSLPSKDSLSLKETEKFVEDRERDKKRMKATRILSTPHNVPAEEEVGRAGGDAGAARSPARSPAMEEVDDPE